MPEPNNPNPTDPLNTAAALQDPNASAVSDIDETTPHVGSAKPKFGTPALASEVGSLGPYRVLKQLGAGGMGAVYLALDTRLDRKLALKVMLPEFAADASAKERFLREAKAAAKVSHDNVVTVYEADEREGVPYIAMQLLQGYPLDEYLKQKGVPPLPHVIRIVREAALGLAAAHELGLVHRDIKPANLWLEAPNGRVKVLDFGLAKPVGADAELTKSGAVVGTPAYMSPEQARGEKVDHRTDLFSLGAVLYRLCTGRTPFAGPHVMAVLMALSSDAPTPVREINPAVPEALAQFIDQLLAKKPENRPQTAAEVAKRLRAIAEQLLAPPPTATAVSGDVPTATAADLSVSQPVVANPVPNQLPLVASMSVSAPESAFAHLDESGASDENTSFDAIEPAPKKSGKGPFIAVVAAGLLAVVAVALVIPQLGKKARSSVEKPPENAAPLSTVPPVVVPPLKDGDTPAGRVPVWKPAGNDWIDVLALDARWSEVAPSGTWAHTGAGWASKPDGNSCPTVNLPLWTSGSYSVTATVRLDDGAEFLGIALPAAHRNVVFALNALDGTARGFVLIKGRHINESGANPTRTPKPPAAIGQTFQIELTVKVAGARAELTAVVDKDEPIRWSGPVSDLSFFDGWSVIPGRLGLVSFGSRWTVHSLKFRSLDGDATVLGWGPPGHDPDRKAAEWVLSLGGNVAVSGEKNRVRKPAELPKIPFTLVEVNLADTAVTDAAMAQLKGCTGITRFEVQRTSVRAAGLAHLAGNKGLTFLEIGKTKVGDDALALLGRFPALTTVYLYSTEVSDAGMAHLRGCRALTGLWLAGTAVSNTGLAKLKDCQALIDLDLSGTKVTDGGLVGLKQFPELTRLYLVHTAVTNAGLAHLENCSGLTLLNVSNTRVTRTGLTAFGAAVPNCEVVHNIGVPDPKKK